VLELSCVSDGWQKHPLDRTWDCDGNESTTTSSEARRLHALRSQSIGRAKEATMIRKLKSGGYRLYSRKTNPKTGRRRNLGTFKTRAAAEKHERAVQYFKRH
jgi:hypothetical protein